VKRCFKFRIYPTRAQRLCLDRWLGICRELYNAAIEERSTAWEVHRVAVGYRQQSAQLPEIKQLRQDVAEINAQVLQNVLRRVDLAFQSFLSRGKRGRTIGYPRFKGPTRYHSLTWPQAEGFRLHGSTRLRLSRLGDVRIKLHRPLAGNPKTCTVKREGNSWFAIFSSDSVQARHYPPAVGEVGIDVGLARFATLSTGESIENPRWYRVREGELKKMEKSVTRKRRGSKRWQRATLGLFRIHADIRNQRKDFHHKLAYRLVLENALIVVEDINPLGITGKGLPGMSKSVHDAGWARFVAILAEKAEEAGRRFVVVPAPGTTSMCSSCGRDVPKRLSDRRHLCPCGIRLDRDLNSAINILRLGRSLQHNTC
jgi:putative transposase